MPQKKTHLKPPSKSDKKNEVKDLEPKNLGSVAEELEVPVASEVVFKKIWTIQDFHRSIKKRDFVDSPIFQCSVNGMTTFWNASIRFWKGPNGKKVTNPLVVCLNLTGCESEEMGQCQIRFQFGVYDATIRHWECCPISSVILNLQNINDLLSVGYKSLGILDRHIDKGKSVQIMIKLQIINNDEEVHNLSQDMARLLVKNNFCNPKDTLVEVCSAPNGGEDAKKPLEVHSWIVRLRSAKMGALLTDYHDEKYARFKYKLDLSTYDHDLITELIRYIYTDKVDNADIHASKLLPLSTTYNLQGLTHLCERSLLETLTPTNVANILLLAGQCGCENLRKAALHYCENSAEIKGSVHIGKTLAWRVMEMVNPDLFLEACESISSSSNLESPASSGSWSN